MWDNYVYELNIQMNIGLLKKYEKWKSFLFTALL